MAHTEAGDGYGKCGRGSVATRGESSLLNVTYGLPVTALFQCQSYQMTVIATDRVLVLRETSAKRVPYGTSCAAYSAMSFKTTAFRASIFFGLATLVAAILWFTPPPCKYLALHSGGSGFETLHDNCVGT